MIVSFISSRAEELYPMLVCSISGNYGHIRLSAEEYKKKQDGNQLTEQERQEFHEPGPFSIVTHYEALLKPNFCGEELRLRLLSMMFIIQITVLDGDSLIGIRVRHQNTALNVGATLVHVSRCHYITLGKFFNCFLLSIFSNPHKPHTMKNALQCIKFNLNHIAIHPQCIEIDVLLHVWFNLLSVEEFDEEVRDEVHHQHRLLSCLDLSTEGQYSIHSEDPSI